METLPPELLTKVFSFLDPLTIVICRQVCQRWRTLTIKIVNALFLPGIMVQIIQQLRALGSFRDTLTLRLVCQLWKEGLDELTRHEIIFLNGLTSLDAQQSVDSLIHPWNPFPSRIIRLQLCYGHDNPENDVAANPIENIEVNSLMETYGSHINYLQVSLQHADCAENHLTKILNLAKNLKGIVLSECFSPYRFSKRSTEKMEDSSEVSGINHVELEKLENLKYLKLEDSECKHKYSNLYKLIIEKAPNLNHLELNGYHNVDMEIIKLLATRATGPLSLTHLKMDAEGDTIEETLKILNKSGFPLKYLSLKISGFGDALECDICTFLLHRALEKFSPTLERLELKLSWFEDSDNPEPKILSLFPSSKSLENLERFKLVGYNGQLDFLSELTSLKALMIVDYNPKSQTIFNSDHSFQQLLPNLKQVHLPLQKTLYTAETAVKNKLQNFMYESEQGFVPKYCGLYQEIFP